MIAILDEQPMRDAAADEIGRAISSARAAQIHWSRSAIRERAKAIGQLRGTLAAEAMELAKVTAAISDRPIAEKMVSEVLPLLDACKFLQRNAGRILRAKHFHSAGRPLWLRGSSFTVERKPFGLILIIAPKNYPLFIPAVQTLHALAAGNAVLIKPAEDATAPAAFFADLINEAGIPDDLVQILPEPVAVAQAAVEIGVDKVIFTGSSENGRDLLAQLARQNTPSVMELSGADAVFVRSDADLVLAAKAIAFGRSLNAGDTCMAPRTIIAHHAIAHELKEQLRKHDLVADSIFIVRDDTQALEIALSNEYGLGAAIFSRDESAARSFAQQLATGFATINDIIVPTADPRFPFGGVRASGFGTTRGEEGLLEMTYPQAVAIRRAKWLPHLDPPHNGDAEIFANFIVATHGKGLRNRWHATRALIQRARKRQSRQSEIPPAFNPTPVNPPAVIPSEVEGSRGGSFKVAPRDSSTPLHSARNDVFSQ